jgi:outer membrane protein TolC
MAVAFGLTMLTGFAVSSPAQLSLTSAVDLALRDDPTVKMAQTDVDRANAALAEARSAYIPKLGAHAGVGRSAGVPLDVPVIFGVASNSLLFNFSQRDYIRSAKAGVVSANLALQDTRDAVAEDVVLTYVRLDNAQQRSAAMIQEYGFATRLVTIAEDRLEAGADTRMDVLKARRTAAQIRLEQLQTQHDVATLSDHLGRLLGLSGTQLSTVSASIPALPPLDPHPNLEPDSFGIQSAFANAVSKQEQAFGDSRWRLRPQIGFGFNYSRISTAFTNYDVYYPGFNNGKSENAVSIGIEIQLPIYDRERQERSHESMDDARHTRLDAENRRNQFLEGRLSLRGNTTELAAQADLAAIERDIAQEELNTVLIQLSAKSAGTEPHPLNPQDEQNARIQVSARTIDLLKDDLALSEARISLMRQAGTLDAWLKSAVVAPAPASPALPTP